MGFLMIQNERQFRDGQWGIKGRTGPRRKPGRTAGSGRGGDGKPTLETKRPNIPQQILPPTPGDCRHPLWPHVATPSSASSRHLLRKLDIPHPRYVHSRQCHSRATTLAFFPLPHNAQDCEPAAPHGPTPNCTLLALDSARGPRPFRSNLVLTLRSTPSTTADNHRTSNHGRCADEAETRPHRLLPLRRPDAIPCVPDSFDRRRIVRIY